MDAVILEKWLRCGFLENSNLFATEEGTPQGGIVSPALANWTLDGLESLLKRTFPSRKEKGRQIYSKVHLVRYADGTPVQISNLRGASPLIPIVRSGI
jgi:RNA-directed DNA polymerase